MQQDDSSCTLLSSLDSFALHSSDNLCQPVSGGDSWAITYINPDVMSPCVEVLRHWSAVSAAVITAVHHSLQSVALSQTVESAFKTATFVNFKSNLKNFHIWDYVHIHNTPTWSIFIFYYKEPQNDTNLYFLSLGIRLSKNVVLHLQNWFGLFQQLHLLCPVWAPYI